MKEQLKIDFNKIQEVSNFSNRDIEIKKSYLNKFIENGFPNRKQENWKFLDINQIISNNISDLSFYNDYSIKNKIDPGKPLDCNMYEDHEKYPDLPKLPDELSQSLEKLKNNKDMNDAFGKEVINSYIKLKNSEIDQFKQKENFDKTKAITRWERDNTLDC